MFDWLESTAIISAAFINLILGLSVIERNPKHRININFFLIALFYSLWGFALFLYGHPYLGSSYFWIKITYAMATLMVAVSLHFSFIFPTQIFTRAYYWALACIGTYLTIFGYLLFYTPLWVSGTEFRSRTLQTIIGPHYIWWVMATWFILGWALFNFVKNQSRLEGYQKHQLTYLFYGFGLWGICVNIPDVILPLMTHETRYFALSSMSSLFFSVMVGYTILKHRFLDIRLVIARVVAYLLLLLTLGILYAGGIIFFGSLLLPQNYSREYLLLSTVLSLFTALTFQPLRHFFENQTNHYFYREPYSSEQFLESLGEIIRATLSLGKLASSTLEKITHTMHITQAVFIIVTEEEKPLIISTGFPEKPSYSENTIHNFQSMTKNELLLFDDLEESPTKMLLRQEQISVIMPLKVKSTHHGLLILGEKSSGEVYSEQDINVLEILMPQLSVAIQNAKSYEEISHFNLTLKEQVNLATHDLKPAIRNLKRLDKLKDEFVFIATHELKNPVTAMRGYLSMLQEGSFGDIPKKMHDPLNQLQASNQQLVELVNDLLQIARAEAKTIAVNTSKVKICQITDSVLESVKPLADQKNIPLIHTCPNHNLEVMSDENRLKEIMNNLISNAIKYSNSGTITISYESKDHEITTNVTDQGVGIPQKDQEKIFTRFFRVEEEAAKGIPGTGLGLFIVKQLIEKMGGKIWFTSQYGLGTTFSFSLPTSK
jgi:signal transduction histidine kinase